MTGEPITTIVGSLTSDPELRFTPNGAAVANFTVASNPRNFDKNTNEWVEGEALFMRCSIWREAAENVAESLHKGDRVLVTGKLVSRSWDDKDTGAKRTVIEMQVDEIGPALRWATAKVNKAQRMQHGQQGQQQGQDPWSTPPPGFNPGGQQAQPQAAPPQWAGQPQGQPQAPYPIPPEMYPQGQQSAAAPPY